METNDKDLAPVTYLHGAAPGMKRRSPLAAVPSDAPAASTPVAPAFVSALADVGVPESIAHSNSDGNEATHEADRADEFANRSDDETVTANSVDEREHAEKVLLHRLRGRSLSTAEALLVLNGMSLDAGEASEIIENLTQLGYLDEVKLAEQIVHSHNVRKGLGRKGVETEMRRRKLDAGVMMDALEELPDDEAERAIELATKRIAQLERFDDQTIDRRLTGFLMRKGYSSTVVRLAVRSAMDSRGGSGSSRVRFR